MYDLMVIGAGPGGYEAAIRAAQNGMYVALCEKQDIGGTCLNRGCIPTKALLHAGALYASGKEMCEWGIETSVHKPNGNTIFQKKDTIVHSLKMGIEGLLAQNKVDIIRGSAQIAAPGIVLCNEIEYRTKSILIATGASPIVPRIPGHDLPRVLTSDGLLASNDFPESLAILGGGVIGVEMAEVYAAFGSKVTIIEAMDRILPQMDKEISQNLSMQMKKRGISIITGSKMTAIEQHVDDSLVCQIENHEPVYAECVLLAVGRKPYIEGLFSGDVSIVTERGRILVDNRFETSVPGIYAIGDVASTVQLAHMASAQGIACADLLAGNETDIELRYIPACVYTSPEIACVGMTEVEAKEQSIPVKTGKFVMTANGRTVISGSGRGFIKMVFDASSERLLGAQMMCENATDMIDEMTLALANGMTRAKMLKAVRPHPTFAEGIQEALESAEGRAIHMAPARKR